MTPEMSVATQWQSHLPALLACIAVTDGAVLELGVGHFSTPHLHALCGALGRVLESVEADAEWYNEFVKYHTGTHRVLRSDGSLPFANGWGVAFIDHSPGGANRAQAFQHMIVRAEFVVVHDAQKDAENFHHIEPMLVGVNWHLLTGYFPHTLVCSRTRKIPEVLLTM